MSHFPNIFSFSKTTNFNPEIYYCYMCIINNNKGLNNLYFILFEFFLFLWIISIIIIITKVLLYAHIFMA